MVSRSFLLSDVPPQPRQMNSIAIELLIFYVAVVKCDFMLLTSVTKTKSCHQQKRVENLRGHQQWATKSQLGLSVSKERET